MADLALDDTVAYQHQFLILENSFQYDYCRRACDCAFESASPNLARPGAESLIGAGTLVFILSLGFFVTPALLGPGPSPADDRVLRMMSAPLVGHLDPFFVRAMDETQELLRYVFETNNRLTMSISGTGSAGMEAAVVNLIEPGEEIVVCVNGYFGERMHEMALRAGAKPVRVECDWGGPVDLERASKVWRESNARVLFAVHAETSTGVLQQIAPLREIVDDRDGRRGLPIGGVEESSFAQARANGGQVVATHVSNERDLADNVVFRLAFQ